MDLGKTTSQFLRSRIVLAFFLCTFVVAGGTAGYMIIEDYSLVDGLYMSTITISTVGFGEVQPLSMSGRAFTTVLILFGFISLAFAGHALGQSLLEKVWSGQTERKRMRKQIQSLKGHYILCGFGRVGAAAASYFEEEMVDFVVIEANDDTRSLLSEKGFKYIIGDATHEETLAEAGIKRASGLLALLDADPDNLFIVLSARELNPTLHIISRVDENSSSHKIIRAGADKVISPFASTGQRIADDILNATGKNGKRNRQALNADGVLMRWIDVSEESIHVGVTLAMFEKQEKSRVFGLRRKGIDMLMPQEDTVVQPRDQLLVTDQYDNEKSQSASDKNSTKRLILVDDNPVIVKLYMRLFQKAGFIPHSAENGNAGLDLILKERPEVAVIDYRLPLMSGIEVCRNIRKQMDRSEIKLILFTVDHRDETKQQALEAGADAVVIKSPEASEVIQTVCDIVGSSN